MNPDREARPAKFRVNVRAIVEAMPAAEESTKQEVKESRLWEVYDFEAGAGEADTIRCDTPVTVTAETVAEAITKAKDAAPPIVLDGYGALDSVTLWVDEGIDVERLPE